MIRSLLIASLFFAASALAAESAPARSVEMSLALEPASVLPGLPVSFHVTIANHSERRVVVPSNLTLKVTPLGGVEFTARYGFVEEGITGRWPGEIGDTLILMPGETTNVVFPVDTTLIGPDWFCDPRLNRPGSYRLQLVANSSDDIEATGTLASNLATLTVREPFGEDAKVWEKMQELGGAGGWHTGMHTMNGVAGFVWREHPSSSYLPYVATVLALTDRAEMIRALEAAIDLDPHGSRSEWLRVTLAGMHTRAAREASYVRGGDLVAATDHAEAARQIYKGVLADSKDGELRRRAEHGLADVPDRAQLEALRRQR
jgi:hypothetical protein